MSELVCKTLELLAETKGSFVSAVKNIFNTKSMATLKISELSVGDWVGFEMANLSIEGDDIATAFVEKIKKPARIKSILGDQDLILAEVDNVDNFGTIYLKIEHILPVPITSEILEKNGWSNDGMYAILRIDEHRHLEYYYHEHRLRKWYCGVDEWQNHAKVNDITFAVHCYSVNQLQHALRLAGVDKEINLIS